MRILVAEPGPAFSVADVHAGYLEAFAELGEQVESFRLADRLFLYDSALLPTGERDDGTLDLRKALTTDQAASLAANGLLATCYQWWPDLVVVISAFFIPAGMLDLLRARGHQVVIVHTEEPYEHDREVGLAGHADCHILNDPTHLDAWRQATSAPVVYLPHAYRPGVHHPGPPDPALACDLGFVGTGFASRIDFLERMNLEGLTVRLGGNWSQLDQASPLHRWVTTGPHDCTDNADAARLYRSAAAGLNLYRREANQAGLERGWALGPREVEMAACGLWYARDPRGEGDQLLAMLPTFTSPAEATDLIRWALARPDQRHAAAGAAAAAVADRTFGANACQLLRLLDRQPVIV